MLFCACCVVVPVVESGPRVAPCKLRFTHCKIYLTLARLAGRFVETPPLGDGVALPLVPPSSIGFQKCLWHNVSCQSCRVVCLWRAVCVVCSSACAAQTSSSQHFAYVLQGVWTALRLRAFASIKGSKGLERASDGINHIGMLYTFCQRSASSRRMPCSSTTLALLLLVALCDQLWHGWGWRAASSWGSPRLRSHT